MLLEIAIGDAFGACYEWVEKYVYIMSEIELKYKVVELSLIKPGNYTDDCQMTLAIAEFMLLENEWNHYNIADKFVECFHRDPRRGYAPGFYTFLLDHKNGTDFVHDIRGNSNRSGAAMRAAPVGLIANLEELKEKSYIQSSLTHDSDEGNQSALCAALMVHYFRYNLGSKNGLLDWLNQHVSINLGILKKYNHIPVEGWPCVIAAIDAIMKSNTLSEVLVNCVKFAGDTDTIATIAMGPASLCKELKYDIPQCLVDGLENGPYGRDYIIGLDKQLLSKEF